MSNESDRLRLGRLAGSLIGASFIISTALALVAPVVAGAAGILAALSSTFAITWLAALVVASGRYERIISTSTLLLAIPLLAGIVAVSGGLSSPLALLLVGLAFEPIWVNRGKRATVLGVTALLASVGLMIVANFNGLVPVAGASAWHWLPSGAYAIFVVARIWPKQPVAVEETIGANAITSTGALVLRMAASGDVKQVLGSTREVLGVPAELLQGTGFFERMLVGDRVGYLCALSDVRAGAAMRRVNALVRVPNETAAVDGSVHKLFDIELVRCETGAGEVLAFVRLDEKTRYLREQISAAQDRCEMMGVARNRLLASVSHELRTPLNAIIGFSDMLLLELFGEFRDPRQKEYVTLVRDSGHHLLEVVNAILDVSRMESGAYSVTPEAFRLADAVEMSRSMLEGQANAKAVAIRVDIEDGRQELLADRRAVQQMLINLISNGIKFTPAGGEIVVRTEVVGPMLRLSVRDNGIGIAAEDLDRIGEPFTQVQNDYTRNFDGAGLGLSLVKGLVGLHGGAMSIESALNQGTTVTISLPLSGPPDNGAERGRLIALARKSVGEGGHGGFRKTA